MPVDFIALVQEEISLDLTVSGYCSTGSQISRIDFVNTELGLGTKVHADQVKTKTQKNTCRENGIFSD
jgi:hypothetical protein